MTKRKYTNRLDLPLPIVEAVLNDDYDPGRSDYTATSLLQPARMRRLVEMYPEECVEDISEQLYKLHGKSVHLILERAAASLEAEGFIVERRFYGTFVHQDRIFTISAQIDLYDPAKAKLSDYKTTSVYAMQHGLKTEHKLQLNLQRLLVQREGLPVTEAEIIGIFRDWSADKADNSANYPQAPAVKQDVPFMSDEDVTAWVQERIAAHEAAKKACTQAELPLCSDEETWTRNEDDAFAAKKPGAARALRVFPSRAEAKEFITSKGGQGLEIEERYGKSVRCNRYCPARQVCEQWKNSPRNVKKSPAGLRSKSGLQDLPDEE